MLEVRRENILADCLANLDRKNFSPSKKIKVHCVKVLHVLRSIMSHCARAH